jgi:ABC-2 type transport system permease protein
MNKIRLIALREYTTRVRNKTFLISTFLLPIVMVLFIAGAAFLGIQGRQKHNIAVTDPNNFFAANLKNTSTISFGFAQGVDTNNYVQKGYTAILVFPKLEGKQGLNYVLRSPKQMGFEAKEVIERKVSKALEDRMLQQQGITPGILDSLRNAAPEASLAEVTDDSGRGKIASSGLSYGIGYACGILIYIMMFVYGAQVMRGVMEEKTNRIAEVIVSSVKPFQLMLGKIFGIGAVGLTQFLLWFVLIFALSSVSQLFIPADVLKEIQQMQQSGIPAGAAGVQASATAQKIYSVQQTLGTANWAMIAGCFLFFFLAGYLFYAALFASVGCMVNEDPQEAQSLMLPITMPIIFAFIIMQSAVQNPDSKLAFWGSIIPFTSPIVMMARIPSHPPLWQILLSMSLLVGGFLATGWMAGKIYRTGILMYGKKGSWKEMMKWVVAKH